jgi:hypothetical protein
MVIRRNKSAALNIYITPELKAAVEKAAAADQRSLTSLIEMLLTRHCQQHGFLPAEPKPKRAKG